MTDISLGDESRRKRAIAYLGRKQEASGSLNMFKGIFGWTAGMMAVWTIVYALYYGF